MPTYHNITGEFSGETEGDVLERLYELARERQAKARPGEEFTREQWWAYQRKLWRAMGGHRLPRKPNARRFLQVAVEMGALIEGPKPPAAIRSA